MSGPPPEALVNVGHDESAGRFSFRPERLKERPAHADRTRAGTPLSPMRRAARAGFWIVHARTSGGRQVTTRRPFPFPYERADGEKASHLPRTQEFGFRDPVGPFSRPWPNGRGTGLRNRTVRVRIPPDVRKPRWSSGQDARLSPGKSPVRVRYGVRLHSSVDRAPVYETGSAAGSSPAGATHARAGHAVSPPGCKPDASAVAVRLRPRARSPRHDGPGRPGAVRGLRRQACKA